jgi:hypothetical protein
MSHEPEPWQTNATAPFLTIEKPQGKVSIWSLGAQRFRVQAPRSESEVKGFDEALESTRRLGRRDEVSVKSGLFAGTSETRPARFELATSRSGGERSIH